MGQWPSVKVLSFLRSFSTTLTVCPMLARHVPVTRPTYPQPMTVTSIVEVSWSRYGDQRCPPKPEEGINASGLSVTAIGAPVGIGQNDSSPCKIITRIGLEADMAKNCDLSDQGVFDGLAVAAGQRRHDGG